MPLPISLAVFYTHDSQSYAPAVDVALGQSVVSNTCFYDRVAFHDASDFYNYRVNVLKDDRDGVLLIVLEDVSVASRVSHPILASSQCSVQSAKTVFDKYTVVIPISPGRAFQTRIFTFAKESCTASESYLTVDRVDVTTDNVSVRLNDYVPIRIIQVFPASYEPGVYVSGQSTFYNAYDQELLSDGYLGPSINEGGEYVAVTVKDLPSGHGRCTLLSGERLFKEAPLPTGVEPYTADDVISTSDILRLVNDLKVTGFVKSFEIDYSNIDQLFSRRNVTAHCQIQIPSVYRGFLPTQFVTRSMVAASPYTIGLSLLLACQKEDDDMCASVILEMIHYALRTEAIVYQDAAPVPSSEPIWGFPKYFSSDSDFVYDNYKPVIDNAWLGICLCRTLRFLQDRLPLGSYKLSGTYPNLIGHIKALLKGLAYLCAYSISPSSGWCAERLDAYTFNFLNFSLSASCITSVFLSDYLEIDYDFFIHKQAAKLYKRLQDSPQDPRDRYYEFFLSADSVYERDVDEQELAVSLNLQQLIQASTRSFWEAKFGTYDTFLSSVDVYEDLRRNFISIHGANPPEEYMQLYLLTIAEQKYGLFTQRNKHFPDWAYSEEVGLDPDYLVWSVPEDIMLHPSYEPRYLSSAGLYNSSSLPDLNATAWAHLIRSGFPILNTPPFELYTDSTLAQQADDLHLIRQMWGFGQFWTSVEANRNIHSNIGSVFFSESSTYRDWYFIYYLLKEGLNLARASGPALRAWEDSFGYLTHLASDFFRRNWLHYFNTRTKDALEGLVESIEVLFNLDLTLTDHTVKPFNKLKGLETREDNFNSYELEKTSLDLPFIGTSDYITIAYKPSIDGLIPREVPGFTYLDITCDEMSITVDALHQVNFNVTSQPEQEGYYKDGPVLILPLSKYFPLVEFEADGSPPDNLVRFIKSSSPAGVLVKSTFTTWYLP